MAAVIEKYALGTYALLLTTELNALANNALTVPGPAYNNTAGQTGDGATECDVEFYTPGFASAPAANTSITVWFLAAPDGTDYEDGGGAVQPGRSFDVTFPLRAVTTAQRINRRAPMPPGLFKAIAKDDGTGQPLPASGNTLSIRPVSRQGV